MSNSYLKNRKSKKDFSRFVDIAIGSLHEVESLLIVSRELGIPCVVGVLHATEILKDGDSVEVNAETGIVKIIEKNEEKR